MTDLQTHHREQDAPELILIVRNEQAVAAVDLSELFVAFANDYRRINRGRTLVVARIEAGSMIVRFREALEAIAPYAATALELAKSAKNLKDFVELLCNLFGKAKDHPESAELFKRKRRPGIPSVEKLLQIAVSTGGDVEVHHKFADGEEVNVRVTSPEAIRIREQAKSRPTIAPITSQPRLAAEDRNSTAAPPNLYDADRIAGSLAGAARLDGGSIVDQAIVAAFVSAMEEAGMTHVLEAVAAKLEERGLFSVAATVRERSTRGTPDSEPPIEL